MRYALECCGPEHPAKEPRDLGFVDLPDDHPAPPLAAHGYLCGVCADLHAAAAEVLAVDHATELAAKVDALPEGLGFLADVVAELHGPPPVPEVAPVPEQIAAKADDWLPAGCHPDANAVPEPAVEPSGMDALVADVLARLGPLGSPSPN